MTKRKKPKPWSHSVGDKPNRVSVFERRLGGVLYIRAWPRVSHERSYGITRRRALLGKAAPPLTHYMR
jgi:hypothetical protein